MNWVKAAKYAVATTRPSQRHLFLLCLLLEGCSALKPTTGLLPPNFAGIQGLIQTGDKTSLKWLAPQGTAGSFTYMIFQGNPDSLPTGGVLTNRLDGRAVMLHTDFPGDLPASGGKQIGEVDKSVLGFDLTEILDQNKNYTFQIVAANASNHLTDPNRAVISVQGFNAVAYKGCLSATGVDSQSIKVTFDTPAQATSVAILRNGEKVYESPDMSVSSWVDSSLSPGKTYQYTCSAVLGSKTLNGPEPINTTTLDPFKTYKGCVDATALGADSASLNFIAPKGADKVNIYRNGSLATSVAVTTTQVAGGDITSNFEDGGLQEGWTYTYTCAAVAGTFEHVGTATAVVTTLSANPPTFAGITAVKVLSPHAVSISWGPNSGVRATQMKVYATPGGSVNYDAPAKIIPIGALSTTIDNLGDELPYAFAVRACTQTGVCDTNTVVLNPPTSNGKMPDAGPPASPGISSVSRVAGVVTINAPWVPSYGFVLFRRVAFYCDNSQTESTNLTDYVNTQDIYVTDPLQVQTSLGLANMLAYQNKTCHFLVRDFDTPTRGNASAQVQSLNLGNLTPPVGFAGITSFSNPTTGDQQTTLNVGFTPIQVQSNAAPHGAFQYAIYLLKGATGDACTAGTLQSTLAAVNFPPPTPVVYTVTGLTPNTLYTACVRAIDSDGNIDPNNNRLSASTLVTTPPIFTGLQIATYNVAGVKIDLQWNAATPTVLPIGSYYVRFHMNTPDLNAAGYTQVALPTTNCSGAICSYSLIPANFPTTGLANGGSLYAAVYACDTYNTVNVSAAANCTAVTAQTTKQVTVPNLTPPANFAGITAVSNTVNGTRQNGVVQVSWAKTGCAPAACVWTNDYAGFKIYDLNGKIQPISVSCGPNAQGLPDCSVSPVYQYTISGLGPNTAYRFYVAAFNANFVETATSQSGAINAVGTDVNTPSFPGSADVSSLALAFNQGQRTITLNWNQATDNQTAGVLTYNIFQQVKSGTSCSGVNASTITTPITLTQSISAGKITAPQTISATSGGLVYAYRVTVVDAQGNTRSATDTACLYIPDLVPPVFATMPSAGLAYQAGNSKNWAISWSASDNSTATGALISKVYVATGTSNNPPKPSANLFSNGVDPNYFTPDQLMTNSSRTSTLATGAARFPDATNYVGRDPSDISSDRWYFYLVVVFDADGNYIYDTVPVFSSGFRIMAFTRPTGTTAGGKILVVEGSGFSSTTSIYMGNPTDNKLCVPLANNDSYFELSGRMTDADPAKVRQFIACTTPANTAGKLNLYAVDSGLQVASANLYEYYTPTGAASENPCDQAYGLQTTGPLSGSNTAASPQIVCNAAQLALINNNSCDNTDNYSSIWDNIYFGTTGWPGLSQGYTPTVLDGNANFLIGLRPVALNGNYAGLFDTLNPACTATRNSIIKRLSLVRVQFLDANITAITSGNGVLATVAGRLANANLTLNDTHFHVVDATRTKKVDYFAGVIGQDDNGGSGPFVMSNSTVNLAMTGPAGANYCAGVGAYFGGAKTFTADVFRVRMTGGNCGSTGGLNGWSQGHTVTITNSNFYANIAATGGNTGAIWGTVFNGTVIANNVAVFGSVASNGGTVGGLFGYLPSAPSLKNVSFTGSVSGTYSVGGLIGKAEVTYTGTPNIIINGATFNGTVTGTSENVGGMIGDAYIVDNNPFSSDATFFSLTGFKLSAASTVTGVNSVGGMIGSISIAKTPNFAMIAPVIAGKVTGHNSVGGVIGTIIRYDNTNLTGTMATLTQAVVTGNVTGDSDIGGLVGRVLNFENTNSADTVFLAVKDSYVANAVSGANSVGGLAGSFVPYGSKAPFYFASFRNCFARVSFPNMSSATNAGRIIGYVAQNMPDSQMSSVYYDGGYAPDTVIAPAVGYGTLQGLTNAALSTAQFTSASSFTGWDFSNTWQLSNGTYPTLVANPE